VNAPLLDIEGLNVDYTAHGQRTTAVCNVTLAIPAGETVALVGQSGCGKSTLALAIMGLLPPRESALTAAKMKLGDTDLLSLDAAGWPAVRGKRAAMIFQDPFSCLNPVLSVRYQLEEVLNGDSAAAALSAVHLNEPERILESYPHQLSGGQRQRIMIAMALAQHPDLLIADEPTTALDVTIQKEIIDLLIELQQKNRMSLLFVTHNMALIKRLAHTTAVMRNGEIVESGTTDKILNRPEHPYTIPLLKCIPRLVKSAGPLPTLPEEVNV
jgi:ABC-type dipeptide/oligopeptide/nickel transport system ATPase component